MHAFVYQMGTAFSVPDEKFIKQGDKGDDMYFIINGDCVINVRDHNGNKRYSFGYVYEGNHFGEIAMLFKCKRTCTVLSRTYNIMAILTYERYRMLANDYPNFKTLILKNIRKYHDPFINYLERGMRRVPYFLKISREIMVDIVFKMEEVFYEKG